MMPSSTFIAYVDESGDEGFQFRAGSSAWFVLSCIVLRRAAELQEVKLVDDVRALLNSKRQPQHRIPEKKPLHFRDLPHEQRKVYAQRVGEADLRALSVLIHKPDLASPEKFTDGSRLYFFAVASGFFYAVEPSPYGLTEDGYARLILPRVYRHQKQLWGYGVKVFPHETEEKRRNGEVLPGWK